MLFLFFIIILLNRITEGLLAANDHFLLAGKNGYAPDCEMLIVFARNPLKMSEAIHDMYAYTNLTDAVMLIIMGSTDPQLKKVFTVKTYYI